MKKSLLVLVVSAALAAASFAASGGAQKATLTVGDFAVKVASAIGEPVTSPAAAVNALKSKGVKIADANASLTEGIASRILADLGMKVSTSNPDSSVTPGKADQLVAVVGLVSSASTTPGTDLPTQCLELKNRGECNNCCLAATGCDPTTMNCSPCAKFCKTVLPPGKQSPSDPQP